MLYPVIYGAADNEDWTDPKVWKKANPSLGETIGMDKVVAACESARQNPGEENAFRQLRLNQWVKQAVRWMPMEKWDGPTFGQKVMQAFKQAGSDALWSFVFEDLIPAGRYLFRTEGVPVIKRKLHELANDQRKSTQIIDVEAKDIAPAIEEPVAIVPLSDNIIDLAG